MRIFRMYLFVLLSCVNNIELYVFCDVLEIVIVVIVYLKIIGDDNVSYLGFILGKVKLVLMKGYIILWLEFCGVVFVLEIG